MFPTLDHKPARIPAYVGVFEAPSSLGEVVEGLVGVDDGQNRRKKRKRLAEWRNLGHRLAGLNHELPDLSHDHDGLCYRYFQSVEDSFELDLSKQ